MDRGCNPHQVFDSVLETGRTMNRTNGPGFMRMSSNFRSPDTVTLHCFQPPCGGSLFVIRARRTRW